MDPQLDAAVMAPSGALLATQIALSHAINRRAVDLVEHDSTTLDLLTRLALDPDQRLRGVELCRQLMLSPSHISRRIDRAEQEGLVRREPDPSDRRAQLVTLTDAGREVVGRFAPLLSSVLTEVIHDTLSPDEIASLISMLGRLEAAARHSAEGD